MRTYFEVHASNGEANADYLGPRQLRKLHKIKDRPCQS